RLDPRRQEAARRPAARNAIQDPARERRASLPLQPRDGDEQPRMTEPSVDLLGGVRVVELAQFVFVPVTGALLADWGADVVKIEHPVTGDGYRGLVSQGILQTSASGINQSMELANRGKRSVGIDVSSPEGRDVLLKL